MTLSPQEIRRITDYLNCETLLPPKVDLLFIPGTRLLEPAHIAINLYQEGIAPYIVLTGGNNRYTGENEANQHHALLREANIPEPAIILENRSMNTLENALFAKAVIAEKMALQKVNSVLVIAKWMHSRRVLMTLKHHFPQGIRYYCRTYSPKDITPENWHQVATDVFGNVLKNWERISHYLAKGDIAEIKRVEECYT
jgi:DUF218 domain-containing protein